MAKGEDTSADFPSPAEQLLDVLGPIHAYHTEVEDLGDFGMPSRGTLEEFLGREAHQGVRTRLGPLETVHVFWFAGMSCDGCTVSVTGARSPSIESLLLAAHPGLPRVVLHHPVVNLEAGPNYLRAHEDALRGTLGAPYVIILEGSITDELVAHEQGGYWAAQGEQPWGEGGEMRSISTNEWVARLAPGAAASIAIGTCATWGGIPASAGNPTGAMSLMDFLGRDYRSALGVPVVNVPGCAPVGDNFMETVAALLYFLQGFGPLPEFDELGRPAWLFNETVHRHCVRGAYYEEGDFAKDYGDANCLVEIGCWGPVVNCNITSRGAIDHIGGCMNAGGPCIGCTMPGFPDKFTPFYKKPPGAMVSSKASVALGTVMRPMRMFSNEHLNREMRWDVHDHTPTAWARERSEPGPLRAAGHRLYDRLRTMGDRNKADVEAWGKRREWTEEKEGE